MDRSNLEKKSGDGMKQFKSKDYFTDDELVNISKITSKRNENAHTHEFIELVYILSGGGTHEINYESYPVKRGDLLFINYNQIHSFSTNGEMTYANFLMKPEFMSNQLIYSENIFEIFAISLLDEFDSSYEKYKPIIHFSGQDRLDVETITMQMLNEFNQKQIGYKAIINGYFRILFAKMIRAIHDDGTKHVKMCLDSITPDVLNYINENYLEQISLKELAERSFYSPSYFSRIFKKYYGKNLTEYIQEKRILTAKKLLLETNLTIEQIGSEVGYSDRKQFYKIFKEYTGVTPNSYRKTNGTE